MGGKLPLGPTSVLDRNMSIKVHTSLFVILMICTVLSSTVLLQSICYNDKNSSLVFSNEDIFLIQQCRGVHLCD